MSNQYQKGFTAVKLKQQKAVLRASLSVSKDHNNIIIFDFKVNYFILFLKLNKNIQQLYISSQHSLELKNIPLFEIYAIATGTRRLFNKEMFQPLI